MIVVAARAAFLARRRWGDGAMVFPVAGVFAVWRVLQLPITSPLLMPRTSYLLAEGALWVVGFGALAFAWSRTGPSEPDG
jgi:ABC-type uncharacterized transport system permease subunit